MAVKKFLDANGVTYLASLLDNYPDNEILGTVISAIQDALDEKQDKGTSPGSIPTNVSSFTNDAGYLTLATLPKYDGTVV